MGCLAPRGFACALALAPVAVPIDREYAAPIDVVAQDAEVPTPATREAERAPPPESTEVLVPFEGSTSAAPSRPQHNRLPGAPSSGRTPGEAAKLPVGAIVHGRWIEYDPRRRSGTAAG